MKKVRLIIFLFTLLSWSCFSQNCNFTLDAGADTTLCENGLVQLNATTSATPISVNWSPPGLFADPTVLDATADISGPTTLLLTVEMLSETNLVINGDFSLGDTGFSSDYIYGTGGGVGLLSNEGQYAIADNAGDTHTQFDNCVDHSGGGNMMVINASGLPNNIWCQTIAVEANTDYDFSAWITSVTEENPAQLQFSINGNLIGNIFNASSNTCSWNPFTAQWNAGNAATAEICIVNSNLTPNGNDFAMDDISFRQICVLTDEVTIDVTTLDATWINPGLFCETDTPENMADWLTITANTGGNWTINGMIASIFEPNTLGPGLHEVIYTVTNATCTETFTQTLGIAPFFYAGAPLATALCEGENQIIILSDLLINESPDGNWEETSVISSTGNAFDPVLGTFNTSGQLPGDYLFLYAKETIAPCPATTATVTIVIRTNPIANAGIDQTIDCFDETTILGDPDANPDLDYQWMAEDGTVLGEDSSTLVVEATGVYTLNVADPVTGCFSSDEVIVTSNISDLSLTASITPISCNQTNDGVITIGSISGGNPPYLFSIDGENFMSTMEFTDLEAGDYTLTAVDVFGCETTTFLSLEPSNQLLAFLSSNLPDEPVIITLGESVTLDVFTNVNPEKIDTIIWTPEITDCPGCYSVNATPVTTTTYTITVVDANGCIASDVLTIIVEKNDNIFIPNVFSPNDDGFNDFFYIQSGQGVAQVLTFDIFDRWGGLVFQNKNFPANVPSSGWNGKTRGQQVRPGVYVFVTKIEMLDGQLVVLSGEVTLLR